MSQLPKIWQDTKQTLVFDVAFYALKLQGRKCLRQHLVANLHTSLCAVDYLGLFPRHKEGSSFSLGLNLLSSAVMKSDPPSSHHPLCAPTWKASIEIDICCYTWLAWEMGGCGTKIKSRGIIIIINSRLKTAFYNYMIQKRLFFFFFQSRYSYTEVFFWIAEVLRRVVWDQAVCVLKCKTCMLAANMIRLQWKCSFWLLVEMSHAYLGPCVLKWKTCILAANMTMI